VHSDERRGQSPEAGAVVLAEPPPKDFGNLVLGGRHVTEYETDEVRDLWVVLVLRGFHAEEADGVEFVDHGADPGGGGVITGASSCGHDRILPFPLGPAGSALLRHDRCVVLDQVAPTLLELGCDRVVTDSKCDVETRPLAELRQASVEFHAFIGELC
jgi:hypothetical protein